MKIMTVLPRNMRFGPSNATSIDLCVRDLLSASRHRDTTTVVCCENESLYAHTDLVTYPRAVDASRGRKARFILDLARVRKPDVIFVQQHLPTAASLAARTDVPVVLHRHNMTKRPVEKYMFGSGHRWWKARKYNALAGMVFVSAACRAQFDEDWPEVTVPTSIVPNGLAFEDWKPAVTKEPEIICVGRVAPEKGILEAVKGAAAALELHPDWRARFILAEPFRFAGYLAECVRASQRVGSRISFHFDVPHAEVKAMMEKAAIAVVPSRWQEPFGRTAVEGHAAGCAVVTSGTGGLAAIGGGHHLRLPRDFVPGDIASSLDRLIGDDALRNSLAANGHDHCATHLSLSATSPLLDSFLELIVLKWREQKARRPDLETKPVAEAARDDFKPELVTDVIGPRTPQVITAPVV